jgi:hypothetical protein
MKLEHDIPATRDFPRQQLAVRRAHLVREVSRWHAAAPRRRRRIVFALVPAAVLVLAATGFTTYALTREPTQFEAIGCFDEADLGANVAVVNADGRDPADACGEVWRTGAFGEEGKVPPLRACVLETGAVGVFPRAGAESCAKLGLAELPATYAAQAKGFAGLRDAILVKLGAPATGSSPGSLKCVGEERAKLIVRRELEVRGYGDWTVEVSPPFSAERPCATVSFDHGRKAVVLVPVWDD